MSCGPDTYSGVKGVCYQAAYLSEVLWTYIIETYKMHFYLKSKPLPLLIGVRTMSNDPLC